MFKHEFEPSNLVLGACLVLGYWFLEFYRPHPTFQNSENNNMTAKPTGVLVIGGGVAGIQAALDLADAGHKVYLVEKEPSIGGVMAALDKTYPTMDCSI